MGKRKKPRSITRLRVMAEYASSGIWAAEPVGPFRHAMVSHASLSLPVDLAARFDGWIERYTSRLEGHTLDVAQFNAEGRALAEELKRMVGSSVEVVFQPEREDGSLDAEEVVSRATASMNVDPRTRPAPK